MTLQKEFLKHIGSEWYDEKDLYIMWLELKLKKERVDSFEGFLKSMGIKIPSYISQK